MKNLAFLSIGIVVVVGGFFAINGCGARGKVAMDKVTSAVDRMLGELEVKRQQISDKMDALEKGVAGIRKSKIETDVQKEMLHEKVVKQKELQTKAMSNLKKVGDLLKAAESASGDAVVAENGKEIKKETLNKYAKNLVEEQKSINTKLKGFEEAEKTLARVVKTLDNKEKEYTDTLDKLKHTLDQIDAKRTAVEAMKAASKQVDGQDNLSESVAKLEKDIEDLNVSVETSLRLEDDKWAKSEEAAELEDAKSIIEASGGNADLIGEIDSLLNQ